MGEPLLHPRVVEYVGRVAEAGLRPIINTNGALLTPQTAEELMDAGLAMACLNVGEIDEQYEAVYGLPFERTRANVEHFLAAAPGRCIAGDRPGGPPGRSGPRDLHAGVLVSSAARVGSCPSASSTGPAPSPSTSRPKPGKPSAPKPAGCSQENGGAARCWVPFLYPFIGYDGNYYLCSSDWRKEVNLGNVFEHSLVDLFDEKAERVRDPLPDLSRLHPRTDQRVGPVAGPGRRRAPTGRAASSPSPRPDGLLAGLDHYSGCVAAMCAHCPRPSTAANADNRRLIPVRS